MSKNYEAIYDIFAAIEVSYPIDFNWGEVSDMEIYDGDQTMTQVWLMPLRYTATFPNNLNRLMKNYAITMYFYQPDDQDSSNEKRRKITQDCDAVLTEYLIKLKDTLMGLDREFTLNTINAVSFFKQTSHVLTGIQVDFNLIVSDDFEYC